MFSLALVDHLSNILEVGQANCVHAEDHLGTLQSVIISFSLGVIVMHFHQVAI